VRQQITEAAHVEIRSADWAIAEMIGLNEKGPRKVPRPLLPLAYIRPATAIALGFHLPERGTSRHGLRFSGSLAR
jgi:hypothetical protein